MSVLSSAGTGRDDASGTALQHIRKTLSTSKVTSASTVITGSPLPFILYRVLAWRQSRPNPRRRVQFKPLLEKSRLLLDSEQIGYFCRRLLCHGLRSTVPALCSFSSSCVVTTGLLFGTLYKPSPVTTLAQRTGPNIDAFASGGP